MMERKMRKFLMASVAVIGLSGLAGYTAGSAASDCSRADVMDTAAHIFWHLPAGGSEMNEARLADAMKDCQSHASASENCKAFFHQLYLEGAKPQTQTPTIQDVTTDRMPANGDTVT
jgi:hypothetical protein